MNLSEAARLAGVTERQANHWFHEGLILPTLRKRNGEPVPEGTRDPRGYRWDLAPTEVLHLVVMADLVRLGMFPTKAAELARRLSQDNADREVAGFASPAYVEGRAVTITLRDEVQLP